MKKINNILIILLMLTGFLTGIYYIGSNAGLDRVLICFAILPVVLVPKFLNKVFKLELPDSLELVYLIFIIFAHYLGAGLEFYVKFNGLDKFTHLLSGVLTSLFALFILKKSKVYKKNNYLFNILFILGVTFMVAGIWEIFEFTVSKIMGTDPQHVKTTGVDDTMLDTIMAFTGSVIFIIINSFKKEK